MWVPVPTEGFGQMQAVPHRPRSDIPSDIVLHKWHIKKVEDRGYISPNYCVVKEKIPGSLRVKGRGQRLVFVNCPSMVTAGTQTRWAPPSHIQPPPPLFQGRDIKDGSGPTFCSLPWRAEPSCGHERVFPLKRCPPAAQSVTFAMTKE